MLWLGNRPTTHPPTHRGMCVCVLQKDMLNAVVTINNDTGSLAKASNTLVQKVLRYDGTCSARASASPARGQG